MLGSKCLFNIIYHLLKEPLGFLIFTLRSKYQSQVINIVQRVSILGLELALNLRDDALSANECAISVESYREYRLSYMLHHIVSDVDSIESDIGVPDLRTLTLEL